MANHFDGKRLRRRREALGRSQEWLAERAPYERTSSITRIEGGTGNPPARKITNIAAALDDTSVGWLFGEGPDGLYTQDHGLSEDSAPYDLGLPILTMEQVASAGEGTAALAEVVGPNVRHVQVLVQGDSMEPEIMDGDAVVLDLRQTDPDVGQYVVGLLDGQVYVKKLAQRRDGSRAFRDARGRLLAGTPDSAIRVVQIRRVV